MADNYRTVWVVQEEGFPPRVLYHQDGFNRKLSLELPKANVEQNLSQD